jgi:hypothetical protein
VATQPAGDAPDDARGEGGEERDGEPATDEQRDRAGEQRARDPGDEPGVRVRAVDGLAELAKASSTGMGDSRSTIATMMSSTIDRRV